MSQSAKNPKSLNLRGAITVIVSSVLIVVAFAGVAAAHDPPKNLKKVGDHWTAWDPPMDLPADADIHIIQSGDTLWDLAERFLGSPYLWPQIWERNSYILDAHWIYPGDPLVMGIQVESQDVLEMTAVDEPVFDEIDEGFRYADAYGRIQQLGSGDDIYCSGYVGEVDKEFLLRIDSAETDFLGPRMRSVGAEAVGNFGIVSSLKYNLMMGDVIYLDRGSDVGLAPGDVFTAVQAGNLVRHPVSDAVVGRLYNHQGRVRVLSVQEDSAIAEVSYSCEQMNVGVALEAFVPEPVPTERRSPLRPVNYPAPKESLEDAPRVLLAKDGILSIGQDHVVFIELPNEDTIAGDIFTVYRVSEGNRYPVVIGEVAVLAVYSQSAVAKVLESRYPIYIGDLLALK